MVSKLVVAQDTMRVRLRWAILGVSIPLILQVVDIIANYIDGNGLGYAEALPVLSPIALYGSVAYVLTRSHYIDPRFTLNRAAVLSATGACLIAGIAAVDWLTSRVISRQRLSDAIDAAAAVALGFVLNRLHSRIERALERFVFRAKHRAETRLRMVGESLKFATNEVAIEGALVFEAVNELKLVSAALFRDRQLESGAYERVADIGWEQGCASVIDPNDRVVRMLRMDRGSVDLREWPLEASHYPSGSAQPRLAIPVLAREELVAFTLYSGHRDHTELDVSEVELLCSLAGRGSVALDHIEIRALRAMLATHPEIAHPPALATVRVDAPPRSGDGERGSSP
jgi:hypothetical protein